MNDFGAVIRPPTSSYSLVEANSSAPQVQAVETSPATPIRSGDVPARRGRCCHDTHRGNAPSQSTTTLIGGFASDETRAIATSIPGQGPPSSQPITDYGAMIALPIKANLRPPRKRRVERPSAPSNDEIGARIVVPFSDESPVMARDATPQQQAVVAPPADEIEDGDIPEETGAKHPTIPRQETPLSPIVAAIYRKQRDRRFCIKNQSRCDRSVDSFIVSHFPPLPDDLSEMKLKAELKARHAIAGRIRMFGEYERDVALGRKTNRKPPKLPKGDVIGIYMNCQGIIQASAQSREVWDSIRKTSESELAKLARQLPVYAWAKGVKGLGDLGLAIVVGEAPILGQYKNEYKLWKRLGLGLVSTSSGPIRQQKRTNVDQANAHAFAPSRRAEIFTLQEPLLFSQWKAARDEDGNNPAKSGKAIAVPAHPDGPYGAVYAARKARTKETHPEWVGAHRECDARRIMIKALVADLWREWRKCERE